MPTKSISWMVPALLALVLFSWNIGGYDLWPADEPRFGLVAREMVESGDYLAPRVNNQPYLEKPPLLMWAIAAASWPFGDVTEISTRIPPVLAGVLTVICTFVLAQRFYGAKVAWWAALILMTTTKFWFEARTARTDILLTACLAASLLTFWWWYETRHRRWLVVFYAAIAAAVMAKGPPGLIFPLLLIVAFFWREPEERRQTHWVLGLTAVAGVALLWLIPARMAVADEMAVRAEQAMIFDVVGQLLARAFFGIDKAQWPWYYIINLPFDWLPWSLFFPWTLLWLWRHRREDDRMRYLLCWILPAFVLFSIAVDKRQVYLLPLYPAIAILVARSVLDLAADARAVWRIRTATVWTATLIVIALIPIGLLFTPYRDSWRMTLVIPITAAIGFAFWTSIQSREGGSATLHHLMAFQTATLCVLTASFVFPVVNEFKSARHFLEPVRILAERDEPMRLYSLCFTREEYVYYARHFHEPVLTEKVPVPAVDRAERIRLLRQQRRLRHDIADAVDSVALGCLTQVTANEVYAMRRAIQETVREDEDVDADVAEDFQNTLKNVIRAFAHEFEGPGAAFLFVQQEDWRWILAFNPAMRHYPVIDVRTVGSRHVMLVGNEEGADRLRAYGIAVPPYRPAAPLRYTDTRTP